MKEVRIGILGNVDSGKTTLCGVLTKQILDNGRGSARDIIMKHKHEKDTGRTSSVSHYYLRNKDNETNYSFVDLAGHEKYLKTTAYGLNGCCLDYVFLLVGANMGVLRMTKEHLGLAVSLKIPIVIVITKIDICPESIFKQTLNNIKNCLKIKLVSRNPILIRNVNDVDKINDFRNNISDVPIIAISNTSGKNVDVLNYLIRQNLNFNNKWENLNDKKKLFVIESCYNVPGVGLVLSGVTTSGIIKLGDRLKIGPIYNNFHEIIVKSIHNNYRESINELSTGNSGCINIKIIDKKVVIKRNRIKKGKVLIESNALKNSYREFVADIKILHHPTTIKINYEPVIHCGTVSQSAKIFYIENDLLRTGDTSIVKFRFKNRSEYIEKDTQLIFREGKTKGVGRIIDVIS